MQELVQAILEACLNTDKCSCSQARGAADLGRRGRAGDGAVGHRARALPLLAPPLLLPLEGNQVDRKGLLHAHPAHTRTIIFVL